MLKKTTFAFVFLLVLNSCAVQQKSLLMDDWYAFTKASTERLDPSKAYAFSDGMIRMYGENNGYLMTKKAIKILNLV